MSVHSKQARTQKTMSGGGRIYKKMTILYITHKTKKKNFLGAGYEYFWLLLNVNFFEFTMANSAIKKEKNPINEHAIFNVNLT